MFTLLSGTVFLQENVLEQEWLASQITFQIKKAYNYSYYFFFIKTVWPNPLPSKTLSCPVAKKGFLHVWWRTNFNSLTSPACSSPHLDSGSNIVWVGLFCPVTAWFHPDRCRFRCGNHPVTWLGFYRSFAYLVNDVMSLCGSNNLQWVCSLPLF